MSGENLSQKTFFPPQSQMNRPGSNPVLGNDRPVTAATTGSYLKSNLSLICTQTKLAPRSKHSHCHTSDRSMCTDLYMCPPRHCQGVLYRQKTHGLKYYMRKWNFGFYPPRTAIFPCSGAHKVHTRAEQQQVQDRVSCGTVTLDSVV